MKTRLSFHFMILLSCLLLLPMAGCGKEDEEQAEEKADKALIGLWKYDTGEVTLVSYWQFNEDNTFQIETMIGMTKGRYKVIDDRIKLTVEETSGTEGFKEREMRFEFKGEQLILIPILEQGAAPLGGRSNELVLERTSEKVFFDLTAALVNITPESKVKFSTSYYDGNQLYSDELKNIGKTDFLTIPSDGKFFDEANDVTIDFIDIIEAFVKIDNSTILCTIRLRRLPEKLTFNQSKVEVSRLEYKWALVIDTNNDNLRDYEISVLHFKPPNSSEITGNIISNTQHNIWKTEGNSSRYLAPIKATITNDSVTLKVER